MDPIVLETDGRLFLTGPGHVANADDVAAQDTQWADAHIDKSNPHTKWLVGNLVESDVPNRNKQFWTKDDLAFGEYSIRYSPVNMLHRQRVPVGFTVATQTTSVIQDGDEAAEPRARIQSLIGIWSHIFPYEAALIDQADAAKRLFISMETRAEKVHCAGPNGCDKSFDYMALDTHCDHIKERKSIRHLVNPTFRGTGIIIPPTEPGWTGATATVLQDAAIRDQAALFAEQTEPLYLQANSEGRDLSPESWEMLMATILSLP